MNKLVQSLLGEVIEINGKKKVCNVVALLTDVRTGKQRAIPGSNIVTNAGDLYYAQKAAGETPTKDFPAGGMRLGTSGTTPQKTDVGVTSENSAGRKLFSTSDGTYPKTNDDDADNTGSGTDVVTWRMSYGTAEANITGIQELAIVDSITNPTAALTHALFSPSFNKTVNDTLKVFVNHTFNGV